MYEENHLETVINPGAQHATSIRGSTYKSIITKFVFFYLVNLVVVHLLNGSYKIHVCYDLVTLDYSYVQQ